jgi:hypothetical protein
VKALSIRQPWAWAIIFAGKDIENRDWKPANPGLRFRGRCLVHASLGMTLAEYENGLATMHAISETHPFPEGATMPPMHELTRGALLGTVDVVDIVAKHSSPWFFGPIGLVLREPRPFKQPIPLKGMLGFFDVPDGILPREL